MAWNMIWIRNMEEDSLGAFEKKILRRTYGAINEGGV